MKKIRSATELLVGENKLTCSKCGQAKELTSENFYRTKTSPVGFQTVCKECRKEYYRENQERKKSYQKEYWRENLDYYRTYNKVYQEDKNKAKEIRIKNFKKRNIGEKFLMNCGQAI